MKIKIPVAIGALWIPVWGMGAQPTATAEEYVNQAEVARKSSQPDVAVDLYEKAAVAFKASGNTEGFVDACNQLGIILTRQDKYEKAKTYLDQALSTGLASLEPNHLLVATTYISLGVVYNAEEKYGPSLEAHHKALSIRLLKLGENDASVATSYGNIGNVHLNNKAYDKAIDAHLKAMKIRKSLFGETSAEITQSFTHLGRAYREKKDYATSLEYFEKALKNKTQEKGEGHKELASYYKNISDIHYLMNNKETGDLYKARAEASTRES